MDLDSGDLLLYSGNVQAVAGTTYVSVYINGEQRFIPYYEHTCSMRMPRYTYADLPSPATHVYTMVLCTDTVLHPAMQPLFSNGLNWYPTSDPTASWAPS
ncbi:MAG: hypothetical protein QM578_07485 [Pantoea sp.]|uniref:hypothetical protein n=1 Tax=Pantoea sp. TaxID=69393 RepID=UPI0039E4DC8B